VGCAGRGDPESGKRANLGMVGTSGLRLPGWS